MKSTSTRACTDAYRAYVRACARPRVKIYVCVRMRVRVRVSVRVPVYLPALSTTIVYRHLHITVLQQQQVTNVAE